MTFIQKLNSEKIITFKCQTADDVFHLQFSINKPNQKIIVKYESGMTVNIPFSTTKKYIVNNFAKLPAEKGIKNYLKYKFPEMTSFEQISMSTSDFDNLTIELAKTIHKFNRKMGLE